MSTILLALWGLAVFYAVLRLVQHGRLPLNLVLASAAVHLAATVYYYASIEGDWIAYYKESYELASFRDGFGYFRFGTKFIVAICHSLLLVADFTRLELFIAFSLAGFLGLMLSSAAIASQTHRFGPWWYMVYLFLPGLHIWTCAIGKDSLIFLPLSLILYLCSQGRNSPFGLGSATLLVFLIRPHVALLIILAACSSALLATVGGGISTISRIGLLVVAVSALIFALPLVQEYTGVNEVSIESAAERMEYAATKNQKGDGAVDITVMSPPLRMFTYMFRPLFFDVKNALGWAASFENLIYLVAGMSLLTPQFVRFVLLRRFDVLFCLAFCLAMWFVLGMTTANLGLALRQKTQILPFAAYLVISFHAWRRGQKLGWSEQGAY